MAGGVLTASVFIGQFCSPLLSTPLIATYGYEGLFQITSSLAAAVAAAAVVKACAMGLQIFNRGIPTMKWHHTAKQGHVSGSNPRERHLSGTPETQALSLLRRE
jgi:hypothetical protein